jgi:hypothetical protein
MACIGVGGSLWFVKRGEVGLLDGAGRRREELGLGDRDTTAVVSEEALHRLAGTIVDDRLRFRVSLVGRDRVAEVFGHDHWNAVSSGVGAKEGEVRRRCDFRPVILTRRFGHGIHPWNCDASSLTRALFLGESSHNKLTQRLQ